MAHNRYLERGGEDCVAESEISLLRVHGSEVDLFERDNSEIKRIGRLRTAARAVWSQEAYVALRAQLRDGAYDVLHVHNFFPLISPAVYHAARAENVPIVQTIHNYRLICPGGNLLRDGRVCESCVGRALAWPGVVHRCYRESRLSSGAVASMIAAHRLLGTWNHMVDYYIALTEFARSKLIEGGLRGERIVVKPNFLYPDPGPIEAGGENLLYVGRLSPEKGIDKLINAWRLAGTPVPLRIIGTGPLEELLKNRCRGEDRISFLGYCDPHRIYRELGRALALCFPSILYEGMPLVIIEAFAIGTPIIAAGHGAAAELVQEKKTGLFARPGDAEDLARQLRWACDNRSRMAEMGRLARCEFERKYTAEQNFQQLMDIYDCVRRKPVTH